MGDFSAAEIEAGRRLFAGAWDFISAAGGLELGAADERARDCVRRPLQCRQVEPDQCADRPPRAGAHLEYARPHPGTDFLRRPGSARAGRHAGLRLCGGGQDQGRRLDRSHPRLSARPRHAGARLCADRRAPRAERRRRRHSRYVEQSRRQPRDRADQMRPGRGSGARRADRSGQSGDTKAAGGVSRSDRHLGADRRRHRCAARRHRAASGRARRQDRRRRKTDDTRGRQT